MSVETPDCHPLSLTRRIEDFPVGNIALSGHQRRLLAGNKLSAHPHAWLDPEDVISLLANVAATMIAADRTPLAWVGDEPDFQSTFISERSFLIRHPWDLLRANEQYVGSLVRNSIEGEIHPAAVIEGVIHLGPGSRILPGVVIEGNAIIGANCKIGPNCYIRGNTSIGDDCHIGQSVEIKNCLILSKTSVGHLSYVGDSVLGENVNFGAGTTVSNLRHDGKNHRSMIGSVLVDTGRRKFGSIIGDGVHTGINTSIYPGRMLWPGTTTLPGEIVSNDILSQ
jgi:UDP-N-acetylglucosamine diphosphorylase / glucose-1-phosphate thymidylyltransferase / UDP-N-acetylgalactosamine diphosphorylase / glucosamine-1-phosphate N-acetyltransferase / galactosamine-1-phosphate N-acetyltransferase